MKKLSKEKLKQRNAKLDKLIETFKQSDKTEMNNLQHKTDNTENSKEAEKEQKKSSKKEIEQSEKIVSPFEKLKNILISQKMFGQEQIQKIENQFEKEEKVTVNCNIKVDSKFLIQIIQFSESEKLDSDRKQNIEKVLDEIVKTADDEKYSGYLNHLENDLVEVVKNNRDQLEAVSKTVNSLHEHEFSKYKSFIMCSITTSQFNGWSLAKVLSQCISNQYKIFQIFCSNINPSLFPVDNQNTQQHIRKALSTMEKLSVRRLLKFFKLLIEYNDLVQKNEADISAHVIQIVPKCTDFLTSVRENFLLKDGCSYEPVVDHEVTEYFATYQKMGLFFRIRNHFLFNKWFFSWFLWKI